MVEFILNGKTIKVRTEDIDDFLQGNPDARPKDPREFDVDEYDLKKKIKERQQEAKYLESPGKSQEASQPQINQQEKDTELSSEPGSSDLAEYNLNDKIIKVRKQDIEDFEKGNPDATVIPKEEDTLVEATLGKNKHTGFVSSMIESFERGLGRAEQVDPAMEFFLKGKDMSEEDIMKLVEEGRKIEERGQSEAMMQHNKRYGELVDEHGPGLGFFYATMENPTAMMHAQAESTALMLSSAWNNKGKVALAGGAGYAGAAGLNKLLMKYGGARGKVLSAGWAATGVALGMVSGINETALTTVELVQEQYNDANEHIGGQWGNLTNEERRDWYIQVANDEVLYNDLTRRALKRGVTIGMIDAFTGMTVGAVRKTVGKKMAVSKYSKQTGLAKVTATAVTETGMGMGSELGGQIAAEQDVDAYEILMEGFADKTFTTLSIGKAAFVDKTPKYTINGETVNGQELDRALRIMDDEAFIKADIKVKNSPTVSKLVNDRTNAVLIDQTIDSRVSNINDRAELIKLKTRQQQLKETSNEIELAQIETKIKEITSKYANSEVDVNIKDRKDAIAFALEGKILDRYNSNLEFAKKNASLYGLEIDDTLTQEQIREQYGDEAASADGFIQGKKIVINKAVAIETGAVNVASHELLHGILRKAMVDNPNQFANIREQLKSRVGKKQWQFVEDRASANYSEDYMQANPDEWIALASDAITAGEITYSESVFKPIANFIIPILRQFGFKKIKFNTGKDVFNFLKEYNESIKKGELSKGIIEATADPTIQVTDDIKFAKTNTQEMSDAIDQSVPKDITTNEQFITKDPRTGLSPYDNVLIEIMGNNTLDGYLSNLIIADKRLGGVVSRETLLDDTKFELLKKIRSEYKPVVDGNFRSLFSYIYGPADQRGKGGIANFALGNMKKKYLQTPDASAVSLDVTTPEGQAIRQVEDTSQTEADIDTQDLSIQKQVQERKGIFETVDKGDFVKKIFKFDESTVSTPVRSMLQDINYDTNSLYEDVAADMVSQANPEESSKNRVQPTGILYPPFEIISQTHFSVNPKSIMATKQTLQTGESITARTKIVEAIQNTRSAKGLSPTQRVISSVLPKVNFNPKSEKSIGINTKLLQELYVDGSMRVPNLKGKALNIDQMEDKDILMVFGINDDLSLMPYDRKYDGAIKGFVKQASAFAINQEVRDIVGKQDATIGIGRPDMLFSKSVEKIISVDPDFKRSDRDKIDKILKNFIKDTTYKHRSENEINSYFEAFERIILGTMPKSVFGKKPETVFSMMKKSKRILPKQGVDIIVLKTGEEITINDYFDRKRIELRDKIKAGKVTFGEEFTGPATEYQYGKSYSKMFGKTPAEIRKSETDGTAKRINKMHKSMHRQFWQRVHKSIQSDPANAKVWGNYFSFVGQDANHPHRMGAEYLGHSPKPEGAKGKLYEWEHSMPATAAYLYLINSSLEGTSFKNSYELVMKNYKLIALDNSNNVKLKDAGRERGMGKGWELLSNSWLDRYFHSEVANIRNGIDPKTIIGVNGKTFAEIYNIDEFGRTNKVTHKRSPKQIKNALNSRKAALNVNKYSKTGERKGMSTFDFDDTLARTKSGVRYTIPNLEDTPAPGRKVIFLAGSAGSGKSNVIKQLGLEKKGFKIVNQDISLEWLAKNNGLPANMRDFTPEQISKWGELQWEARDIAQRKQMKFKGRGDGIIVDGTGASEISMSTQAMRFRNAGYDVQMLFVESSLETALARNAARKERSLKDFIVERNHKAVMANKKAFKEGFGNNFAEVNTDNLKKGDPMPTELVNKISSFTDGYIKGRLTAEEFASNGNSLLEQGAKFDFSEFNKVVDGTPGPLLEKARNRAKKFGTKDMFVLTARPQQSDKAIQEFLNAQGLDIPLKNITGLADSTGDAKAQWMLSKFAEGYNDMYFVDDALQNVKAVQNVLNQLDIKSEVVQAKLKFSKTASENFNTILEESKGTSREQTFSAAEAKRTGRHKGWWRIFIPPSAEDFKGLLYRFLGKGRQGEMHMKYLKIKLLDPFAKGIRAWNIYKQEMVNEYKQLRRNMPDVTKMLKYEIEGTGFTVDTAVRVYLWDKNGFNIPGLDESTKQTLISVVEENADVKAFADTLSDITKTQQGYVSPGTNWSLGAIATDLNNVVNKVGRKEFLAEYLRNAEAIFTPENMNKIEVLYGTGFRDALENIMYRMEHGGNRRVSNDKNVNRLYNWINGSIGAIMFFNMRSAILQTISTVNFINWGDNNIFKASAAFANQPQFWTDFAMLFNSPQLKQRRRGIQIDVSASELSKAFKDGKGTPQGVISWLLEKGFTPTQVADSFAIAFGGATLYRNRMKTYLNQGFSEVDANEKAMLDFQEIAEETQQSSREDLISQQQSSMIGRIILAFQNVTMQYTRLTKKALSDLVNGRGDAKTNISKILYYGAVQNIIFASLQTGLAFLMWGDDEEEIEDKKTRVANSALDSLLRGTGLYGAIISTVKNTIIQYDKQKKKDWNREDGRVLLELVNFSPPIGSKLRKIYDAMKTEEYNKGVSEEIGLRIENPNLYKWASVIEAATNIPTQRIVKKLNNLEEAITGDHLMWQRIALGLGWNTWTIGVEDEELEAAKAEAKKNRGSKKKENKKEEEKELKKKGYERVQCSGTNSSGSRCGLYSDPIKAKSWKCMHHSKFTDGMDRDGDGIKEYRCTASKTNGKRCKNKTENKSKKCYAHQ